MKPSIPVPIAEDNPRSVQGSMGLYTGASTSWTICWAAIGFWVSEMPGHATPQNVGRVVLNVDTPLGQALLISACHIG